jgi:hypothetical protein
VTQGWHDIDPEDILACVAQVKRAQAHLLEHLYGSVSALGGAEADYLLEEDSDSVQRREAVKRVRMSVRAV